MLKRTMRINKGKVDLYIKLYCMKEEHFYLYINREGFL